MDAAADMSLRKVHGTLPSKLEVQKLLVRIVKASVTLNGKQKVMLPSHACISKNQGFLKVVEYLTGKQANQLPKS